jgi:hypothetical protein
MLIEALVKPKSGYNHQNSCTKVARELQNGRFLKDDFALGIIDKDKRVLTYLQEFDEVLFDEAAQLRLLKHKQKPHFFIQIVPAIERWILKNVEEAALDLTEFNLPVDFEQFLKITKTADKKHNTDLKALFKALKQAKPKGIETLTNWVTYFKENNRNATIDFFENL